MGLEEACATIKDLAANGSAINPQIGGEAPIGLEFGPNDDPISDLTPLCA